MQIKRTRLRLVTYIQVLSRAAYLPNRYTPSKVQSFLQVIEINYITLCLKKNS
jgi:hypothetical protein